MCGCLTQVTIYLKQDHANPEKIRSNTYHFSGGLSEYVLWLNNDKVPFHGRPIFHEFLYAAKISLSWIYNYEAALQL